jgi:hypothetical protein
MPWLRVSVCAVACVRVRTLTCFVAVCATFPCPVVPASLSASAYFPGDLLSRTLVRVSFRWFVLDFAAKHPALFNPATSETEAAPSPPASLPSPIESPPSVSMPAAAENVYLTQCTFASSARSRDPPVLAALAPYVPHPPCTLTGTFVEANLWASAAATRCVWFGAASPLGHTLLRV